MKELKVRMESFEESNDISAESMPRGQNEIRNDVLIFFHLSVEACSNVGVYSQRGCPKSGLMRIYKSDKISRSPSKQVTYQMDST
jgi:hypothetical protein